MKVEVFPIGMYEENSYVLHENDHVLFIDPGSHAEKLSGAAGKKETVDGIILTHGHEDHTGAVEDLVELFHCPVFIHPDDRLLASTYGTAFNGGSPKPLFCELNDLKEGKMRIGAFDLEIIFSPGHTSGSTMVRCKNALFSGDTLFAGTIGRTDLFSGSDEQMMKTLKMIKLLPSDLVVYPGHGQSTTMAHEKKYNPYLKF